MALGGFAEVLEFLKRKCAKWGSWRVPYPTQEHGCAGDRQGDSTAPKAIPLLGAEEVQGGGENHIM